MSKLTIRLRTQGKAVAALLKLYKVEPDFARELEELRITYLPALEQWLKIGVPNWMKMKKTLTQEEFSIMRDFFLTANQTISNSLADKLEPFLSIPDPDLADQLDTYVESLTDLAYRWRLKAPWAGHVLLLNHLLDMTINMMPEEVKNAEMPIETLEPFLPSAPLPPLRFEVNAYELMFSGRQEIQDKFANALAVYENDLKSLGWRELPSRLERHAYWWFEHYVHHKKYPELEQEDPQIDREGIKKAVWKFTKVLGIKIK
jgi:hypothetical protein